MSSNKACPSLNFSNTKQTMILVVQNHDSWKCGQPSIKAGLQQHVKNHTVDLPVCLLHVYTNECLKSCVCLIVRVQVEHVHPSPGNVRWWRCIYSQDPRLLLSMPLLLQPAFPGSNMKTIKREFIQINFVQYIWLLMTDRLQHRRGNRFDLEEVAWLQRWTQHGPWIFWVGGWVVGRDLI